MSDNSRATLSRTRADALERAHQAYGMRVSGRTWDEIANALGYADKSAAHNAVTRHFTNAPQPDREELRSVWRERLEGLWRQAMSDVLDGKPGAIRAAVALSQRAAALDGLDEPSRATLHTPTMREMDDLVGEILRLRGGPPTIVEADIFADDYGDSLP